jgi:hypothetical protein
MISARCTRQTPGNPVIASRSHHRVAAAVHSRGAPIVGDRATHADRDAVDRAGRVRRELTADRRERPLVHETETAFHVAADDQGAATEHEAERDQIPVVEPRADLLCAGRVFDRLTDGSGVEAGPDER